MKVEEGSINIGEGKSHYPHVLIRGYVGTAALLDFLQTNGQQFKDRDRVVDVLDEGWETLISVMTDGGAISRNGVVVSIGLSDFHLSRPLSELMEERGIVHVSDVNFPNIPDEVRGGLFLIKPLIRERLGFRVVKSGALYLFLIHGSGQMERMHDSHPIIQAFRASFNHMYLAKDIFSPSVPPVTAVKQLLVEAADVFGLGEVNPDPKSLYRSNAGGKRL